MPNNYIITEPAPSSTTYIRSGRGGAGNLFPRSSLPLTTSSSTSSSATAETKQTPASSSSSRRFFSGIGGAGNAHNANERAPHSIEDEFRRAAAREKAGAGHCGIGGAGNVFRRKQSDASVSDAGSDSASEMSEKAKLWRRFSRN